MTVCLHCQRRLTVPGTCATRCRVCLREVWGE